MIYCHFRSKELIQEVLGMIQALCVCVDKKRESRDYTAKKVTKLSRFHGAKSECHLYFALFLLDFLLLFWSILSCLHLPLHHCREGRERLVLRVGNFLLFRCRLYSSFGTTTEITKINQACKFYRELTHGKLCVGRESRFA